MKLSQDIQLIQKLRDDQKRIKEVFEVMSRSYEQKSNQDRNHRVWKSVRYGVSKGLDTAYWSFLEHGYAVSSLMDTAYWSSE
ncbi:hypothetical protein Tco_1499988 [Tanacetum coccineum]